MLYIIRVNLAALFRVRSNIRRNVNGFLFCISHFCIFRVLFSSRVHSVLFCAVLFCVCFVNYRYALNFDFVDSFDFFIAALKQKLIVFLGIIVLCVHS